MKPAKITASSVFVVSGGAKGITAHCVIAMAQRYQCKFLLLGRSAASVPESAWVADCTSEADMKKRIAERLLAQGDKPAPRRVQQLVNGVLSEREIASTLTAVQQAGGQATYLSLDIADPAAVHATLPPALQALGPITGILHGAGSLADKLIEQKTIADFERVYTVKIKGLENLLACFPPHQLDYLVLFGSVAGFYGNAGQADYALANDIFNKTAHRLKQTYPGTHVVTMNWGPWDGGMVTETLKQVFATRNVGLISLEGGTRLLLAELEAPHSPERQAAPQVLVGSALPRPQQALTGALRSYRIQRRLTVENNPFLLDHIIGEHAVLPAVFGVAWICDTCEQLYPGYKLSIFRNFRVLKGIVFDETLADVYTLDLQETEQDEAAGTITFDAVVTSQLPNERQRFHYRGNITLSRTLLEAPIYEGCDLTESNVLYGPDLYRDRILFHGPTFQGVEKTLNISPHKLTVLCNSPILTPEQQGQFPLQTFNPIQTDIQFQCMLIWARRFYDMGGMPMRASLIEHYRVIPPGQPFYVSMEVQENTESRLVARVMSHDEHGRIAMRVSDAEVTLSKRLKHIYEQSEQGVLPVRVTS